MKRVIIDVLNLKDNIRLLEKEVTNLEDHELNLFSKIMSLKNIWNDGYSTSFYEEISEEKESFNFIIQNLNCFKNIYNYVYNTSSKFGKKIELDFNYLRNVISQYNSCRQYFSTINSLYNSLDLRECGDIASRIQNQKNKFNNSNKQLDNYITKLRSTVAIFENMEQAVSTQNNRLDVRTIKSIDFFNLSTVDPNVRRVGMSSTEDIEITLDDISNSVEIESDIINRINNIFVTIRKSYVSNINTKNLNNKQLDFNLQFKTLKNNHEIMLLYINKLKEDYLALNNNTKNSISKDIKRVS